MGEKKQDKQLLETTLAAWNLVVRENYSDRFLVTPAEWKVWENFEKATAARLALIKPGNLSSDERNFLTELAASISRASRLSVNELMERKLANNA